MVEIELKFQLEQVQPVLQRLKQASAKRISLQANYYDTADQALARQGIALRLRKEGSHWVQTLKAQDTGKSAQLQRIEEEIHLGQCRQEPSLDLSLYQHNKTVQQLLDKALASTDQPLQIQFQTRVERLFYVEQVDGSAIEICLDQGKIIAGERVVPLCEMEFELKSGAVDALIHTAGQWVAQHGLWLDVRSKAERGHLLATRQTVSPAARAKPLVLGADLTAEQVLQHIVANCLAQLLPNSAAIAAGVAHPEHTHQARVAIRRLRSALKHFSDWSAMVDDNWQSQLTRLFRQLGTTRDADVITTEVIPQLLAIGAPELRLSLPSMPQSAGALPAHPGETAALAASFTQPETVQLLLDLLHFAYRDLSGEKLSQTHKPAKGHRVKPRISKSLSRLHQQVIKHAAQFSQLDIEQRHDTRKRVKQLRYLIEFVESLYPQKQVKRYLAQLQPVQDQLGLYNDMIVAEEFFAQQLPHNPHFWFALGWSKAQQPFLLKDAQHALTSFAPTTPFW